MSLSACYNAELMVGKWILVVATGQLLFTFFTNPNQAQHLKALQARVSTSDLLLPTIEYHNYWLFSTTTLADAHLTYGYFGRVHITDKISRCTGLEGTLK
jgi:hypothetical protein